MPASGMARLREHATPSIVHAVKPRICICCGESIGEHGDTHSRNPNMCACCSSMWDGRSELSLASFSERDDDLLVTTHFRKVMVAGEVVLARVSASASLQGQVDVPVLLPA
jgi:hypothetical protein